MSEPVVLYVEDNPDNRKLVKRVLMVEDFVVHLAVDGPSALEFVQHTTPDIILMDINLPEMDGYEVTGQMRQMPHLVDIPIVALTANVMKQDKEKTKEAGCDGFIGKPIDIDLLPQQVRNYLKNRS